MRVQQRLQLPHSWMDYVFHFRLGHEMLGLLEFSRAGLH